MKRKRNKGISSDYVTKKLCIVHFSDSKDAIFTPLNNEISCSFKNCNFCQ